MITARLPSVFRRNRTVLWLGILVILISFISISAASAQQFYASPNPIYSSGPGATTLFVNAPNHQGDIWNIYLDATPPFGTLFASGGWNYSANTGPWVTSGMTFFLVDATTGQVIDGLTAVVTPSFIGNSAAGCPFGPFTSCSNGVPATHLGGPATSAGGVTWIDSGAADGLAEWSITANTATPGMTGTVSGTVTVLPSNSCPWVTWQVNGTYTPSTINIGTTASTAFTWTATNPSPSGTCNGWTPESSITYTGTIVNSTNDRGRGTWSNRDGQSGSFSIFGDPTQIPAGETTTVENFGNGNAATQLTFTQGIQDTAEQDQIDPDNKLFQGRQVFENLTPGQPAVDSCFDASGGTSPTGSATVNGSVWNVGSGVGGTIENEYQDTIGWTLASAQWYRKYLDAQYLPCTADIYQSMNILASDPSNPTSGAVVYYPYATHHITMTLAPSGNGGRVTVTKDAQSSSSVF